MRNLRDNPPARFPDMGPIEERSCPWWVVHVKPRQEKALADDLMELNIEYYLPLVTKVTRRRDNNKTRKTVLVLFPGYLSYCGEKYLQADVYNTGRVANIIEIKHQRRFIHELNQIYNLIEKGVALESVQSNLRAGERVKVYSGPLKGIEGIITKIKNQNKLVLSVEGMGKAAMSIDASLVRPISEEMGLSDDTLSV